MKLSLSLSHYNVAAQAIFNYGTRLIARWVWKWTDGKFGYLIIALRVHKASCRTLITSVSIVTLRCHEIRGSLQRSLRESQAITLRCDNFFSSVSRTKTSFRIQCGVIAVFSVIASYFNNCSNNSRPGRFVQAHILVKQLRISWEHNVQHRIGNYYIVRKEGL